MIESVWRDVRTAARNLRKDPGFALVASLTLALGIGVNTVVFSVVRSVVLEPLPYPEPQRLVALWTTLVRDDVQGTRSAYANVKDWRAQSRTLEDIAVHDPFNATLSGGPGSERVTGVRASPSFLSQLGAVPAIGRTFTADEAQRRERVVILSDDLWRRWFGADPGVLGDELVIDGAASQVIGVMPPGFGFPGRQPALWEPHTLLDDWSERRERRGTDFWQVLGRLRPGTSQEDAQVELSAVARRLERAYPVENQGLGVRVIPLHDQVTGGPLRTALWTLWGAVGFVLLIACVNVTNLLLARGLARRREMAVRAALGAGRGRLVRLVLAESVMLAALGAIVGTAAAIWTLELIPWLGAGQIPRLDQVTADAVVLGYSLALALVAALVFGILPGLAAARPDPNAALTEGGRSSPGRAHRRLRRGLVMAEVALALVALTGAGLLGRSLLRVLDFDLGFDADRVLFARVALPPERSGAERVDFFRQVLERTTALQGVEAAGAIDDLLVSSSPDGRITIEGEAAPRTETRPFTADDVTPGFFRTVSVPLVRGRMFTERDRAGALPVVVINEAMARRFWPGSDPVGRRLQLGEYRADGPWLTVVGVVGNFRRSGPEVATRPQLFRPHAQSPSRTMDLLVRSSADPRTLVGAVRAQVEAVDPNVPVYAISTLEQLVGEYASRRRFQARLLAVFSAAALLLATIGIYGLISQSVHQRAGEFGVRVAIGATGADILRLVIGEGMLVTAIGVAVGLAGALGVAHLLRSLLFEVSPADPATLLAVCVLVVGAALLSCYVPAGRAARLDVVTILRGE